MLALIGFAVDIWLFGKLFAMAMVVVGLYLLLKK